MRKYRFDLKAGITIILSASCLPEACNRFLVIFGQQLADDVIDISVIKYK